MIFPATMYCLTITVIFVHRYSYVCKLSIFPITSGWGFLISNPSAVTPLGILFKPHFLCGLFFNSKYLRTPVLQFSGKYLGFKELKAKETGALV